MEEVPSLLPLNGSERASHIVKLDKQLDKKKTTKKQTDDEASVLDWIVQVNFSKSFTEKELWAAYRKLLEDKEYESKSYITPIGFYNLNQKTGACDEMILFTEDPDAVPEEVVVKTPMPKGPRKAPVKKKVVRRFVGMAFIVRLVASHSNNQDDEEDYESEVEEEEEEQSDKQEQQEGEEQAEQEEEEEEEMHFEPELLSAEELEEFLKGVKEASLLLDKKAEMGLEETSEEAAKRAEKLAYIADFCDHTSCIELLWQENPSKPEQTGFLSKDIYDVMLSLGFEYDVDCNCFMLHERTSKNQKNDDDSSLGLIQVTTTEKGHSGFKTDRLESAESSCSNLLFEIFIPHLEYPLATTKAMVAAAKYAQQRLGGQLVDYLRKPFKENSLQDEVKSIISALQDCKIQPGSEECFWLF